MSDKNWQAAEEFMAELRNDPEFQRRKTDRDRKWKGLERTDAEAEKGVLDQLRAASFSGDSIKAIVDQYAPLPSSVVGILLDSIRSLNEGELADGTTESRLAESLVRALAASEARFDGRPLVDCFETTSDEGLKWAIVNTVAKSEPLYVEEWLTSMLAHRYWGKLLGELSS